MNKRYKNRFSLILVIILFVFCSISNLGIASENNYKKVMILHTNDLHGHIVPFFDKIMVPEGETIGGSAYISTLIKNIKEKYQGQVLLLDAGDIAQGTPISNIFRGEPVVKTMNIEGYDAMTLGNHEFDWGQKSLMEMLGKAKFSIVCANVLKENGEPLFTPYIIKKINGIKFIILGLCTPETPTITMPANVKGLKFEDPSVTLNKYLPIFKKQEPAVILLLDHLGVLEDQKMAKEFPDVDIIVGGHSHTFLENPIIVGKTIIVQAGCYGKYLGELELEIDPATCNIVDFTKKDEIKPIIDKNIIPDKVVEELVSSYDIKVKPIMEKQVGETEIDISRTTNTEKTGFADCLMGNLVTDAMREEAKADVAIYNSGGLRSPFYKGKIKMNDVYTTLPFDNLMVVMKLSGENIVKVAEEGLKKDDYNMLQVSGIKVVYNPKAPAGSRVIEISVNNKPIEPGKEYIVVTNDFMASGGDGFNTFKEGKDVKYGALVRDVVAGYLKKHSPIKKIDLGRIQVKSNS